jgi:hypothetical protein
MIKWLLNKLRGKPKVLLFASGCKVTEPAEGFVGLFDSVKDAQDYFENTKLPRLKECYAVDRIWMTIVDCNTRQYIYSVVGAAVDV